MNKVLRILTLGYFISFGLFATAQEKVELIPYGDMNKWMVREIEESAIIGGDTKYIHEIVDGDTMRNNLPYANTKSPWAMSSVLAKVKGVTKASITVFPEKRGNNDYCARLETRLETVKVLGLINIEVLASGTIFLGEMVEPITNTKNPQSKLNTGIPFTKRPKSVQYDYKVISGGKSMIATGFSRKKETGDVDMAEMHLILQYRWEDKDGNIFAKRVGTAWEYFNNNSPSWVNKHRVEINYGDISSSAKYKPYMGLKTGEDAYYAKNSKGKMVPIQEVGWADASEKVTHLILQFSSSNGGAYKGNINNRFWIDNVGMVY